MVGGVTQIQKDIWVGLSRMDCCRDREGQITGYDGIAVNQVRKVTSLRVVAKEMAWDVLTWQVYSRWNRQNLGIDGETRKIWGITPRFLSHTTGW